MSRRVSGILSLITPSTPNDFMMTLPLTRSALVLAVTAFISVSAHAATLTGSFEIIDGSTTYDLTDLGELDWAYWNKTANPTTGSPSNSLNGGTLISDISPLHGGSLRGTSSVSTSADFSFANGTSPTSGTINNIFGIFNDQLGSEADGTEPGLTFTVLLPNAGTTYEVLVWGSEYYTIDVDDDDPSGDTDGAGGIFSASLSGATTYVESSLTDANVPPKQTAIYSLLATADNDNDPLTISYELPSDAFSGNAHVLIDAVAVSVIPEPETVAVIFGLSGLLLALSRRRKSSSLQ